MIVSAEEHRKAQAFLGPPSVTATIGSDGVRCTDQNGIPVRPGNDGVYAPIETKPGAQDAMDLSEKFIW